MAFRKRNVVIGRSPVTQSDQTPVAGRSATGTRPSSLTSHPVTSTGTPSLDELLGGHAGLALGSSLLIEESGTTDFAGALLRYYAAEGICQGHVLHIVGMGDGWVRELPGVAEERSRDRPTKASLDEERMKIAWRYERLGQAGERALPDRSMSQAGASNQVLGERPFCHTFDLTKRLSIPANAKVNHISINPSSPFEPIVHSMSRSISASEPNSVHRLVIPTILSPALYPPGSSVPGTFLSFLRAVRSLLRQYPSRLSAVLTLPLDLYPRNTALIRWAEILSDGVLELTPFPHLMDAANELNQSGGARANEEPPQGMLKVHKLAINTERGEGGAGAGNSLGEDLAFTVSRRKFMIKPFSLPPMEGDQEAQSAGGKPTAKDVDF